MTILVADIKFYAIDDDDNEVLNKEGTHIHPYIYTDSRRPNARFKGSTDWAVRHFGKVS